MDLAELRLAWMDFQRRMEAHERHREQQLRDKHPQLTEVEVSERVRRSTNAKFRGETKELLTAHLRLTDPATNRYI